jgi:hypothetical protein
MAAKRKHNLAIQKTPEPATVADPTPQDLDLLKRMLEGMRVKTILSHKHGCCMSCNYPHILGVCRRNCVCHEAKTYLEARGIKVDI